MYLLALISGGPANYSIQLCLPYTPKNNADLVYLIHYNFIKSPVQIQTKDGTNESREGNAKKKKTKMLWMMVVMMVSEYR
jgi:hypothetical protein